jgi:uncharacterized membrane protein YccC
MERLRGEIMQLHPKNGSRRYRSATAFAFRLTAAAILAFGLAQLIGLRLPLWCVLTALVVTQVSLGKSLKTTIDYFAATLAGVIWGALIALAVPHQTEMALYLQLLLALAPLAFIAALYPQLNAGPVTAAIVVLMPQIMHTTPVASALERVSEVTLGGLTGLVISFLFLPSSAFQQAREIAANALHDMAGVIPRLIEGFQSGLDEAEAHRLQDGIGQQLNELSSVTGEAERERPLRLAEDPLTGPLFRTVLRLRHDLVILGRAAHTPLPDTLKEQLHALLTAVGEEAKTHMQACAAALLSRKAAPSRTALDAAVSQYMTQIDALRQAGRLRELSSDTVEHFLAAGFALEQMHLNLTDLDRCISEWAARQG